jgi:hypothetical protein
MRQEYKIKNFTTSISATRTITEIEEMLTLCGADAIIKNYRGDGRVEALSFMYQKRGYRLPANSEKCLEEIQKIKEYQRKPTQWLGEQAERVTWRVIKDWLDAQLSLIRIGQAEVEQVMLPYMWDGKTSLYEKLKGKGFAALGKGTDEQ